MNALLDQDWLSDQFASGWAWLLENVLVWPTAVQLALVAAVFLVATMAGRRLERLVVERAKARDTKDRVTRIVLGLTNLVQPIIWLVLLWLSDLIAIELEWPHRLLVLAISLLAAWVAIRLISLVLGANVWTRALAYLVWIVAALNILGLLQPTFDILDSASWQVGDLRLSALSVISGIISLTVLVWLALAAAGFVDRRIATVSSLTPSVKLLLGNLFRITILTVAIVAGLGAVGIDLTAFAVFGGALGVGVGFGLQKVVSNFVAGIILLLDRSIKPGDVIVIGETYGWVNSLGARYTSVITRDGAEHLIPNEDLITQPVENWTHTDRLVRLKLPIGVSYDADVHTAMDLILEAGREAKRVLTEPEPRCLLKGFGDSSVDLELRFWIRDPANGVSNVKSQILLSVWDKFHAHGIEIPFPQLDLHVKRGPAPASAGPDRLGD